MDYLNIVTGEKLNEKLPKGTGSVEFGATQPPIYNPLADPVRGLLLELKCSSALFPSPNSLPITISTNNTVLDALRVLIDNQILAVPVLNEDTGDVVSVLSVLDLLSYIVEQFPEEDFVKLNQRSSEIWQSFYGKMVGTKEQIANERIVHLLGKKLFDFEALDPVYSVYGNFPLQTAVEFMVGSKAHRVVVLDQKGHFSNFISQARLLEVLLPVMSGLPELSRPLIELGLWEKAIKDVETIDESEMAYRAFKKMKEKRVSGLAVVNSSGVIVGNISVSDLKLLEFDLIFFNLLGTSVKEYLRLVSKPELLYERPIRFQPLREALSLSPRPVVTCRLSDSLGYIMAILNHYNIHRVYVVDDQEKPIGVVSLHDVLSHIMDTRRTTEAL